jgi:hypothetical protein
MTDRSLSLDWTRSPALAPWWTLRSAVFLCCLLTGRDHVALVAPSLCGNECGSWKFPDSHHSCLKNLHVMTPRNSMELGCPEGRCLYQLLSGNHLPLHSLGSLLELFPGLGPALSPPLGSLNLRLSVGHA